MNTNLDDEKFLALTYKYQWIVVERRDDDLDGYWSVPGKYGVKDEDIVARRRLPKIRAVGPSRREVAA